MLRSLWALLRWSSSPVPAPGPLNFSLLPPILHIGLLFILLMWTTPPHLPIAIFLVLSLPSLPQSPDSSLSPRSKAHWFTAVMSEENELTTHLQPVSPKRLRVVTSDQAGGVQPKRTKNTPVFPSIDDLPLSS